jgi:DNA-directed RNA polymerase specialized sigma24 family protein
VRFNSDDLRGLQAGNAAAWERAFPILWSIAVATAEAHMGAYFPQHIEDVASDALIAFHDAGIHQCKGPGAIIAFVKRTTRFKAIDFVRQEVRKSLARLETQHIEELQVDDQGEGGLLSARLEHFVSELCLAEVEVALVVDALVCVLELHRLDELLIREHVLGECTQREFAEGHGVSVKGVGARKMRILRKLKRHLESPPRLQRIREEIERRRRN